MAKVLMKGNEAIAEAAIRAGCKNYFAYPITPQSEVAEYLSKRLPEVDGVFLQGESEVAVGYMIFGAAAAGARVMTTSSSPGISLMSESPLLYCRGPVPGGVCQHHAGRSGIRRHSAFPGRLFPGHQRRRPRRLPSAGHGPRMVSRKRLK